MILLRLLNLMFLLGLVICLAGAMAGLVVFAPFVGGAWLLTLLAIVGSEPDPHQPGSRPEPQPAVKSLRLAEKATRPLRGQADRSPA